MKDVIIWTACQRPEYAKVSLESIFQAKDENIDFYAYIDNSNDERSLEIVKLCKQHPCTGIIHREVNYMMSKNAFLAWRDIYNSPLNYQIFHCFEEDLIISKEYFTKSKSILSQSQILLSFAMLMLPDHSNKSTEGEFSPWGVSFKREFFEVIQPYIDPFLEAREKGRAEAIEYQIKTFGSGHQAEGDGLISKICKLFSIKGQYSERSYAKDIGAYGYHRIQGKGPTKTLQEWADEPLTDVPGYGIQGIGFAL